jgi:hypothetical protein
VARGHFWKSPGTSGCSMLDKIGEKVRPGQSIAPEAKARNVPEKAAMSYQSETPFDNIESALEYVNQLLEATREAQDQIEKEILRAASPQLARRKQALQLVNYKLDKLSSHITASRRILNDLRTLRRLLLEDRKTPDPSAIA